MEQDVLVTKMIGIVVAVIVAAVVLVPVCNSIADNGGSSSGGGGDSGSGSGGEGTTGTVYTIADQYSQTYPDWPYKSYQIYNPTIEGSSPFNITTSDIVGVLDNFRSMGIASGFSIDLAQIITDTFEINSYVRVNQYTEGGLEYRAGFQVALFGEEQYNVYMFDTNTAQNQQQGKQGSFELICASDGTYTLDMSYYYGGGMVSKSYSGQVSLLTFLSQNEVGYYTMELGSEFTLPIFEGQEYITTIDEYDNDDDYLLSCAICPTDISVDTSAGQYTLTGTHNDTTYTLSGNIEQSDSETKIIIDPSAEIITQPSVENYVGLRMIYASTQGIVGGGGEGGSSDSGSDLGVAGTIIGIIPVFVILAILMGAVGLFYQDRKTI